MYSLQRNFCRRPAYRLVLAVVATFFVPCTSRAYSVLTHEQVVDLLWQDRLRPLLLARFPQATTEELRRAHAFAYGGSLVQDMGYYPFGKKYFSDLVHYVRSGDFITALFDEAYDINEYAFALGALSHYSSDNMGHPTINQVVAMEFPKLRARYGKEVTYVDDPKAHIRTEFGFDMVQVAKNRYTSDQYHDFIGFEIAKPLLERAFYETYGLSLKDVLGDEDLAIGSFRRAVSKVIPRMTRAALLNRHAEMVRDTPNADERKFLYHLSRARYERDWGKNYHRPGFGSRLLAFLLAKIPKVGPATALAFKVPTTKAEDLYIRSINKTVDNYNALLNQVKEGHLRLPNTDFDTGRETAAAEYPLTDSTYAHLLDGLNGHDFRSLTPELQANILEFYRNLGAPYHNKRNQKSWQRTLTELDRLRNTHPAEPEEVPASDNKPAEVSPSGKSVSPNQ